MASRVPLGSTEEVAEYLGDIPVRTLVQWRYKGIGPKYVKVGKYVRYRWSDVEAWLASQERAVGAAV
jgi:predicted DNA-binding transcriptional regulator AlpA